MSEYTNDSDAGARRARLRPKPRAMQQILGTGTILKPLYQTQGMVWPYQPQVTYQQDVDYTQVSMVHTNQDFYAYTRTPSTKLTIEGEFTVQNQTEGLYSLACIHFLRTVTKMYFGQGNNLGTPPPVLLFDAYGQFMFNKLPVIVNNFSVSLPKDIDYVPISLSLLGTSPSIATQDIVSLLNIQKDNFYAWLPAVFSISVSVTVQNTPNVLQSFNLDNFRNGGDLVRGGGWI